MDAQATEFRPSQLPTLVGQATPKRSFTREALRPWALLLASGSMERGKSRSGCTCRSGSMRAHRLCRSAWGSLCPSACTSCPWQGSRTPCTTQSRRTSAEREQIGHYPPGISALVSQSSPYSGVSHGIMVLLKGGKAASSRRTVLNTRARN